MQLAPSKNPEKESKQFALLGLVFSVVSVALWFLAIIGLAFSLRALILTVRTKNTQMLIAAIVGILISGFVLIRYFTTN